MDSGGTTTGGADANSDDWHNVTDAKKRKQIQDRLAQRARRKRLRAATMSRKQTSGGPGALHSTGVSNLQSTSVLESAQNGPQFPIHSADAAAVPASSLSLLSAPQKSVLHVQGSSQGLNMNYDLPVSTSVFSALMINGRVLGLSATICVPGRSKPVSPDVPLSLHPTTLQLLNVHHIGLDQFPFPHMRDNAITYGGMYDDEQFAMDLCTMPSFVIAQGAAPWDPTAWKMEKSFAEKWGFLFRTPKRAVSDEIDLENRSYVAEDLQQG